MNTCEEKLEKMSVTFKKINRSRNSNLKMNNMMRLLIIDMLTNSKGWIEGDIDNRAIDLLNNFQKIKDGIQE
jgi:hypothetical protein